MDYSKIKNHLKSTYSQLKTAGFHFVQQQKSLTLTQHFSQYQQANTAQGIGALKQAGLMLKNMVEVKVFTEKIKQIPIHFLVSKLIPKTQITPIQNLRLEAQKNQNEAYQIGQHLYQKLGKVWQMKGEDLLDSASQKLSHAILEASFPLLNPSAQIRGEAQGALKFEVASWFVGLGEVKSATKLALTAEKGILAESKTAAEAGLKILMKTESNILPSIPSIIQKSALANFSSKGLISFLFKSSPLARLGEDGLPSLKQLLANAHLIDKGGELSKAGRALQKHGNRIPTAFPVPTGNPSKINQLGSEVVKEILNHPAIGISMKKQKRFGLSIDFRLPDGKGVRFNFKSEFIGFLQPWR